MEQERFSDLAILNTDFDHIIESINLHQVGPKNQTDGNHPDQATSSFSSIIKMFYF